MALIPQRTAAGSVLKLATGEIMGECCCLSPSPSGAEGGALGMEVLSAASAGHFLVLDERLSSRDGSCGGEPLAAQVVCVAAPWPSCLVVGGFDHRYTPVDGPFADAQCGGGDA